MARQRFVIDTAAVPPDRMLWNDVSRCLLCEDAPCAKACPLNLEPDRRLRALRFVDLYGAVRDYPAACGDCGNACEQACVLGRIDRPVEIRRIMEKTKAVADTVTDLPEDHELPDLSAEICGGKLENPFLL
ncbi:MAG: 4Fe-4S dicluster domain-containing protein, partial [Oscillospiraceae bacterium]|nr:4Fe-4S dicluster domain-containing protein [Oscillospiraceae bacterium]